jgi:ubiquinone/menaquinone biosynthesis C-methylase UbiE
VSDTPADRNWAWDLYWHADRIASCMDGAERGNYDERLAEGWRSFFDSLPSGSRILDLCTGNGAIAAIAAETGKTAGKQFAITGVDLADIDPPRFVSRYGELATAIRFMGGVNCEQLPFDDAAFDAVVSQYGIEYSALDRSLREAARVLAVGGHLRLGMHAADGKVVAAARAMIADADFLLDEVRLYDVAARCLETVSAAEREPASEEARSRAAESVAEFQQALAATAEYLPRACDRRMVEHSGSLLTHTFQNRRHFELPVLLAKVDEVRSEADAHRARSVAMVEAAVSKDGAAAIADRLAELGMIDTQVAEQRDSEGLLGYAIESARPRRTAA